MLKDVRCYSKVNTDINMENNGEFIKNQKHTTDYLMKNIKTDGLVI